MSALGSLSRLLPGFLAFGILGTALAAGPAPVPDLSKPGWHGRAICYSGYRQGQHPDRKLYPSQAQVLEDLRILERNWTLLRLYGSDRHAEDVLATIQRHHLTLKVMLGAWMSGKPGKEDENALQVKECIRLAKAYPGIVVAVNVGNEALVSWSDHRMTEAALIPWVDRVRAAVPCRVTVADDFLYWKQPGNQMVKHIDFIVLHTYPLWGHQDIDEAMPTTVKNYETIQALYPGMAIVFGETGWASFTDANPQHVAGAGSEAKQKRYFEELDAWAKARQVTTFNFEAFDEPWKGEGTEGHWGLFTVDRVPKRVMRDLYPGLKPSQGPGAAAPSEGK